MWLAHGRSAWIGVLNRAELALAARDEFYANERQQLAVPASERVVRVRAAEPPSYPSCLAQSALILCSGRVSPRVSVFRLRMAPPNPERRESSEEGAPVSALPVRTQRPLLKPPHVREE
ncbi:unnamed protein product [Lampetra planeri]